MARLAQSWLEAAMKFSWAYATNARVQASTHAALARTISATCRAFGAAEMMGAAAIGRLFPERVKFLGLLRSRSASERSFSNSANWPFAVDPFAWAARFARRSLSAASCINCSVLCRNAWSLLEQFGLSLLMNYQGCQHARDDNGADDAGFEFCCSHKFHKSCADTGSGRRRSRQRCRGYRNRKPAGAATTASVASVVPSALAVSVTARADSEIPELVHRAADSLLGGILADTQRQPDRAEVLSFQKTQHDRVPVGRAQLVQCLVENGAICSQLGSVLS